MKRRTFLKRTLAASAGLALSGARSLHGELFDGKIITVTGPISPADAGIFLPHEHVMSKFGDEITDDPQYDSEVLDRRVRPYLEYIHGLGGGTLADCTTRYFGRNVEVLRELSINSGLQILSNTGYYGAANDRYIPEHAYRESAEQVAQRWINEWTHGIQGTGIRPGFIKIGVDEGALSDIDAKLVRAAAQTHRQTGLVMAVHTGDSMESVTQQLRILAEEGVHPSAWIWVHAQNTKRVEGLVFAAKQGAWIELDGVSEKNAQPHLEVVQQLKQLGYLNNLLLSHDGNSYRAGTRPPKGYDALFTTFIPLLQTSGFSSEEIYQLTQANPAKAFTVAVRSV